MTPRQEALLSKDISQGQFIAVMILIVAGSLAGAAFELGRPSLWVDEAFTWFFVTMPWEDMFRAVRLDAVNPPAYYVFTKLIVELLGTSEAAIRVPSLLAHVFGLAGSFWLGHLVANRIGAVIAGWFWGFHPMMLWFARDARPYAWAAALAVISLALYRKLSEESKDRTLSLTLPIATIALGLLTHYFFLVFLGAWTLLAYPQFLEHREELRRWSLVLLFAMVPLLGWLWWFYQLPSPSFGIGWIQAPDAADLLATAWNLLSGYGASISVGSTVFGLMATLLLAAGLTEAWRAATLALGAPLLGIWLFSQFRPVYVDRYFIILVPFLAMIIAEGGRIVSARLSLEHHIKFVSPRTAAAVFLIPAAMFAVYSVHRNPAYQKENWEELAAWLQPKAGEFQVLISEPELQLPLAYYGLRPETSLMTDASCSQACIWIQRQPYTYAHAFTQSVEDPRRSDWRATLPAGCRLEDQAAVADSGIAGWLLTCEG